MPHSSTSSKQYKTCSLCKQEFPATPEYFHRDSASTDGLYCQCKECYQFIRYMEYDSPLKKGVKCEYCGEVFDQRTSNQRFCSESCRHRAYKPLYEAERAERGRFLIFERDGFKCVYCGRSSIEDGIALHADHIKPRSQGGSDEAQNLVTACEKCNLEKADSLIEGIDRVLKEVAFRNRMFEINPKLTIKLNL